MHEGIESGSKTAHSTAFSVISGFLYVEPPLTCARPGCHPEHATVQWTVALPSTQSGRREASRSDERREPPEPKDPARRQPGASGCRRAGSFGSLRSLRMTMRWLARCQWRFNIKADFSAAGSEPPVRIGAGCGFAVRSAANPRTACAHRSFPSILHPPVPRESRYTYALDARQSAIV